MAGRSLRAKSLSTKNRRCWGRGMVERKWGAGAWVASPRPAELGSTFESGMARAARPTPSPWRRDRLGPAGQGTQSTSRTHRSGEELRKCFLPLGEGVAHLACDEQRVGQRAQRSASHLILDQVTDERAVQVPPRLRHELVAVVPLLEWSLLLHVGKVMI